MFRLSKQKERERDRRGHIIRATVPTLQLQIHIPILSWEIPLMTLAVQSQSLAIASLNSEPFLILHSYSHSHSQSQSHAVSLSPSISSSPTKCSSAATFFMSHVVYRLHFHLPSLSPSPVLGVVQVQSLLLPPHRPPFNLILQIWHMHKYKKKEKYKKTVRTKASLLQTYYK